MHILYHFAFSQKIPVLEILKRKLRVSIMKNASNFPNKLFPLVSLHLIVLIILIPFIKHHTMKTSDKNSAMCLSSDLFSQIHI